MSTGVDVGAFLNRFAPRNPGNQSDLEVGLSAFASAIAGFGRAYIFNQQTQRQLEQQNRDFQLKLRQVRVQEQNASTNAQRAQDLAQLQRDTLDVTRQANEDLNTRAELNRKLQQDLSRAATARSVLEQEGRDRRLQTEIEAGKFAPRGGGGGGTTLGMERRADQFANFLANSGAIGPLIDPQSGQINAENFALYSAAREAALGGTESQNRFMQQMQQLQEVEADQAVAGQLGDLRRMSREELHQLGMQRIKEAEEQGITNLSFQDIFGGRTNREVLGTPGEVPPVFQNQQSLQSSETPPLREQINVDPTTGQPTLNQQFIERNLRLMQRFGRPDQRRGAQEQPGITSFEQLRGFGPRGF